MVKDQNPVGLSGDRFYGPMSIDATPISHLHTAVETVVELGSDVVLILVIASIVN